MSIDFDDEILQDFLLEAGELLEDLGEQLVELEQAPEDLDLLNAIFRSFHTIKGGAGFLNITPMVAICHKAEDVFNALRQGEQKVQPAMMDTVLQVVDVVNQMFEEVRDGQVPTDADQSLLDSLAGFVDGDPGQEEVVPPPALESNEGEERTPNNTSEVETASPNPQNTSTSEPADNQDTADFDDLLQALPDHTALPEPSPGGSNSEQATQDNSQSDLISEAEFEDLLDEIHGKGKHGTVKAPAVPQKPDADPTADQNAESQNQSEPVVEINEAEFEDLLDQLHGKGKHGGVPKQDKADSDPSQETEIKPAESAEQPQVTPDKPAEDVAQPQITAENSAQKVPAQQIKENKPSAKPAPAGPVEPKGGKDTGKAKNGASKNPRNAQAPAETTVRVDVQTLDDIMNMVGELVLVRNRFENLRATFDREQIAKTISNLDVVTSDLQREVMKTRMQPIKKVFGRFPRVVRDLARSLNKEIKLELRGEDTDLDKNLVEALADPLVHLVRNAVDHGIELPGHRESVGKPREGHVVLTASQEGDHIQLTIEDDGKGMNPDKLRAIVVEKGLMDEESAARLEDRECFGLIFMPGFSTKSEISDISGRGVGMDVVKTRINQMSGSVDIDSAEGKGSKIIIKVPLTLAIMPTLMVKLNDRPFALPLTSVVEILDLDLSCTNIVEGQQVIVVRDHVLPLFYLGSWLSNIHYVESSLTEGHVVVVNVAGRKVGFVVDHLIGQEEVVIKALGAKLQGVDGLSGATITGDGNIALIIDVPSLMNKYAA